MLVRDERYGAFCPVRGGRGGAAGVRGVLGRSLDGAPERAGRGVRQPAGQHRRRGDGRAARGNAAFRGSTALTREYFQVPVAEVVRETDEACSLVLDVPASLVPEFSGRPGQFVTVRVPSERCGSVARCDSRSSSPALGARPAITAKRTEGGYASSW